MTNQSRAAARPSSSTSGAAGAAASGPFVINLSSSTTPMALEQPRSPELARFTFFVSRRREEGRERFRLHMGYFESVTEAEDWLGVVREVYPAAWVGEAPGKRLQAARAQAPSDVANTQSPPASSAATAAPAAVSAPAAAATPPAPARAVEPAVAAAQRAEAAGPSPRTEQRPAVVPTLKPLNPLQQSNVREVLAQLDSKPDATLSDTQVLKLLEQRRSDTQRPKARVRAPESRESSEISMLRPDDTQTMRALREQVAQNEQVSFAVQLAWSVQPVDLDKVPPLAIFSAYTLYTVEGSREGRRWYGLRLGFFSDAISAKQVAFYVRSEFSSVAVIPVTARERERAGDRSRPRSAPAPQPVRQESKSSLLAAEEFKLFEDERDAASLPTPAPAARAAAATAPAAPASATAGSGSARPVAVRAPAAPPDSPAGRKPRPGRRGAPQTLDETLEILGASELQIDTSHTLLNDSGVRHIRIQADNRPPSAFSRLLDRLTDRLRQN